MNPNENQNSQKTATPADMKVYFTKLEDLLELYLVKKAPALPANAKEFIVKFGPYISIVLMLLLLPVLLAALSIGSFFAPIAMYASASAGFSLIISLVFTAVTMVLYGIAIPGLLKRSKAGWNFLFYATLVSAVRSLVTFDVIGLVVGTLVSLYVLFQVKEYYK
jgi:hypothetical protein